MFDLYGNPTNRQREQSPTLSSRRSSSSSASPTPPPRRATPSASPTPPPRRATPSASPTPPPQRQAAPTNNHQYRFHANNNIPHPNRQPRSFTPEATIATPVQNLWSDFTPFSNLLTNHRTMHQDNINRDGTLTEPNQGALSLFRHNDNNNTKVALRSQRNKMKMVEMEYKDKEKERKHQRKVQKQEIAYQKALNGEDTDEEYVHRKPKMNKKEKKDLDMFEQVCRSQGVHLRNRTITSVGHTAQFIEQGIRWPYKVSMIFYGVQTMNSSANEILVTYYNDQRKPTQIKLGNGWSFKSISAPGYNDVFLIRFSMQNDLSAPGKLEIVEGPPPKKSWWCC